MAGWRCYYTFRSNEFYFGTSIQICCGVLIGLCVSIAMVSIQDPFVNRSLLCAQLMLPLVRDMEAPPPKPTPVVDEEDMEENVSHMTLL